MTEDWIARRIAVEDIASRIDRAVDEKDWATVESCFADNVEIDVGALSQGGATRLPRNAVMAGLRAVNPADKATFHARLNIVTTVSGDQADMTAHSYGWNLCDLFDPPVYEVWGTMDYGFSCTDGRWEVTRLAMRKWREAGNHAVNDHCG